MLGFLVRVLSEMESGFGGGDGEMVRMGLGQGLPV